MRCYKSLGHGSQCQRAHKPQEHLNEDRNATLLHSAVPQRQHLRSSEATRKLTHELTLPVTGIQCVKVGSCQKYMDNPTCTSKCDCSYKNLGHLQQILFQQASLFWLQEFRSRIQGFSITNSKTKLTVNILFHLEVVRWGLRSELSIGQ